MDQQKDDVRRLTEEELASVAGGMFMDASVEIMGNLSRRLGLDRGMATPVLVPRGPQFPKPGRHQIMAQMTGGSDRLPFARAVVRAMPPPPPRRQG
jgi:hypothetical protein